MGCETSARHELIPFPLRSLLRWHRGPAARMNKHQLRVPAKSPLTLSLSVCVLSPSLSPPMKPVGMDPHSFHNKLHFLDLEASAGNDSHDGMWGLANRCSDLAEEDRRTPRWEKALLPAE